MTNSKSPPPVMAGLAPAIHGPAPHPAQMDARNKSGHDGRRLAPFVRMPGAGD